MKIKLTESKLKQIVAESVKEVLSELDWKTTMNASRKAAENGDDERARRFETYADQQFNKKHGGYDAHETNGKAFGEDGRYTGNLISKVYSDEGVIGDNRGVDHGFGKSHGGVDIHRFNKNGYQREFRGKNSPELNQASAKYTNTVNNMGRDMQNYYGGTAQYEKGKGWNS